MDDLMFEQNILLGGQISDRIKRLKLLARLSPDYAELFVLYHLVRNQKKHSPDTFIKRFLIMMGEVDMLRSITEITRLSMILGDTRKRYSGKGLKDELKMYASRTSNNPET